VCIFRSKYYENEYLFGIISVYVCVLRYLAYFDIFEVAFQRFIVVFLVQVNQTESVVAFPFKDRIFY